MFLVVRCQHASGTCQSRSRPIPSLREALRNYAELSQSTLPFLALQFYKKDLPPTPRLLQVWLILPPLGHILSHLAANVADMLATCCNNTRFCSNFGQMGRCCKHKIEDVGTFCVGLSQHPYFPPKTRPAQVHMEKYTMV